MQPNPSTVAMQLWLLALRQDIKFTRILLTRLQHRNLLSTRPIVSTAGGAVVSLTTHGERIQSVHLGIESIGNGSSLPSRMILWLDNETSYRERPDALRRLEDRGLEIKLCDNFGPHTKYYPYLLSGAAINQPLVIADDDMLYTRRWLGGLLHAYGNDPTVVSCYRAHCVSLEEGTIGPYTTWRGCGSSDSRFRHFATGVSGCIYPTPLLTAILAAGDAFLTACPKADDVWLHVNSLRAGFKIKQIFRRPLNFPAIPGTESRGLRYTNVGQAGNDRQIRNTYTEGDIALMRSELLQQDAASSRLERLARIS